MGRNKNFAEEIGSFSDEEMSSASSPNNQRNNNKRTREGKNRDAVVAPKRPKIVWTYILHARFLQAINHIGLERAVPKKILEFMNVRGLTRENVASHLQKYRMFLRKVAEKGLLWSIQNMSDRLFRSSFATGYNPSLIPSIPLQFPQKPLAAFQFPSAGFCDSPPQIRHSQSSLLLAAHSALQNPLYLRTLARNLIPSRPRSPALMSVYQRNQFPPEPEFEFPLPWASNYAGIVLNSNGELGTGQMLPAGLMNRTGLAATGAVAGGGFGNYLGQGGFSASPGNSIGNSSGVQLPFNVPNQETASILTPNLQQNANVSVANSGGNGFDLILFNEVSSPGGNTNVQQVVDEFDLEFLLNSTTSNQQQQVQGAVNTEISNEHELNPNDFLNVEFSNSCAILDKEPLNEHCSQEIQSVEQAANANPGSNGNSVGALFPTFEETQSGPDDQMDSDIADMIEALGSSDQNQEWAENFVDLLGKIPN